MTNKNFTRGERMVQILLHLFRHPSRRYSTTEIMEALSLSEAERRNVQRDLQSLLDILPESPIRTDGIFPHLFFQCNWQLAERVVFPEFNNSLLNFMFLKRIAGIYPATKELIDELVLRIQAALPAKDQEILRKLDQDIYSRILFMGTPARHEDDTSKHLSQILVAIQEHRKINTDYLKNTEGEFIRNRIRVPLLLVIYQSEIYVGCRSESNPEETYFLKLRRLQRVHVLSETYKEDPVFLQKFRDRIRKSGGMFGETMPEAESIHLKFPYYCKNLLEENPYHPSLRISRPRKGAIDVRLHVEINRSLVQWILGFYDRVEVISPLSLRKELADFSLWLAEKYS